jgi:hypothetical protein
LGWIAGPVARGPRLVGKPAEEFLTWQAEYIQKCLQKSLSHATMAKNEQEVTTNGKR